MSFLPGSAFPILGMILLAFGFSSLAGGLDLTTADLLGTLVFGLAAGLLLFGFTAVALAFEEGRGFALDFGVSKSSSRNSPSFTGGGGVSIHLPDRARNAASF